MPGTVSLVYMIIYCRFHERGFELGFFRDIHCIFLTTADCLQEIYMKHTTISDYKVTVLTLTGPAMKPSRSIRPFSDFKISFCVGL